VEHKAFEKYPETSNSPCMHDGEPFSTRPVPIPSDYSEGTGIFRVYGHFCSVNCALAYIIETNPNMSNRVRAYFEVMIRAVFGIRTAIKPAPPIIRLKKFPGGTLTLDEFRKGFEFWKPDTLQPPFVPSIIAFEESVPIPESQSIGCEIPTEGLYSRFIKEQKEASAELSSSVTKKRRKVTMRDTDKATNSPKKSGFATSVRTLKKFFVGNK